MYLNCLGLFGLSQLVFWTLYSHFKFCSLHIKVQNWPLLELSISQLYWTNLPNITLASWFASRFTNGPKYNFKRVVFNILTIGGSFNNLSSNVIWDIGKIHLSKQEVNPRQKSWKKSNSYWCPYNSIDFFVWICWGYLTSMLDNLICYSLSSKFMCSKPYFYLESIGINIWFPSIQLNPHFQFFAKLFNHNQTLTNFLFNLLYTLWSAPMIG
jgi:hypothetical protein